MMRIDPAVAALLCLCGTLLFGTAAIHKVRDLQRFAASLAAYELVPVALQRLLVPLIPLTEAVLGACLLITASRRMAALAGAALLCLYALAIAINLRRGRHDLACGCGGPNDRRPVSIWLVWRNSAIAAALLLLLLPAGSRPLERTDAVTIAFGSLTCVLIYACFDRLLGLRPPRATGLSV